MRPTRATISGTATAAMFSLLLVPLLAQSAGAAPSASPDGGADAGGADAVGIHVSGGQLVESDGSPLLLRGVSHAHTWYASETGSFADIAEAGANSVRVVLSDGTRWNRNEPADVANVVSLCEGNRLICVLEDHDTTGYGEEVAASTLDTAASYWISLLPTLRGTEDRVLINIGNEPYGNNAAVNANWAPDTSAAIHRLRDAGFEHTIVVDAPSWGQDWQGIMRDSAADVLAADPDGNTVFSVHMYGVYDTAAEVTSYLDAFTSQGLPIIVGEFGHDHSDGNPDEDTIMSYTRSQGIGWFAWSWSGNGGGVEYLDMVTGFDPAQRTSWGNRVITGPDGLAETSVRARVFADASS
ncbi:glycoside hydrolase family 5 protein [Promicromonospora alba]|uniref:Glycoside hydrolase family 5 protein n=1 Tax=Promicromonospora alba TaxID=1616110 RepID=A0ABV9HR71_9MICO